MTDHKTDLSRRGFLAASMGCLASAGMLGFPTLGCKSDTSADLTAITGDPIRRRLGNTDIEVPIVSMGGGGFTDPGFACSSYEAGMRLFDTDARYQNGRHERLLGRAFARLGVRDKVIIMTKVHTPEQRAGLSAAESKQLLYKTFEGCLRRLQTDYVDILLVHDVSSPGPIKDPAIMEAMSRLKQQGTVRYIGTATHANMAVAIDATVEAGIYDVVLTSINFTMADDSRLLGAIANAAAKGLGIIAMKTQAGGHAFPNPDTLRDYSTAVVNSAALKWVCHNENVATSIPGISNFEHLHADLAVAHDPGYTEEERRFLSDNRIRLGMEFCRQCRSCLASCPRGVDIPTLMRTHMYARQYGNFEYARLALDSIASEHGLAACRSCETCLAECANSVNIRRKIEELKLVYG